MNKLSKLLIFMFLLTGFIFAQDQMRKADGPKNEEWNSSAKKLSEAFAAKISLSDDQLEDLTEVIYEYHEELLEEKHEAEAEIAEEQRENDMEEVAEERRDFTEEQQELKEWLNNKIDDILDDNQQNQWSAFKAEWWQSVDVSIQNQRKNMESKMQDRY